MRRLVGLQHPTYFFDLGACTWFH